MTKLQQSAIDHLFTGGYLCVRDRRTRKKKAIKGTKKDETFRRFTLYKGNQSPVRIYNERTLKGILQLCKHDAKGKFTLNLNLVRQQRKNSYVKALYLELKKAEAL